MEKTPLSIPLGAGLQTDVADEMLPLGRLLDLENAFQLRTGEVVKRFGTAFTALPPRQPFAIGTHKGALVSGAATGGDALSSLATTGSAWVTPAAAIDGDRDGPVTHKLFKVATGAIQPDIAIGGGYYCVAYKTTAGALTLVLADTVTGTTAATFTRVGTVAAYRPIVCNGFVILVYTTTAGDLVFFRVNLSSFATNATTVAGVTAGGPDLSGRFDVMLKDATTISVVYPDGGFLAKAHDFVPATATATAFTPQTAAAAGISCNQAGGLAWCQDLGTSGKIALASADTVNGVTVHWGIPATGATRNATNFYTMDAGATANVLNMVAHTTASDATGAFAVLYTISAAAVSGASRTNNRIVMSVRASGSITGGLTLARSVTIESKTWTVGGSFFVMAGFRSDGQGNRYVLGVPIAPVAAPSAAAPLDLIARQQGFPRSFEPAYSNAVAVSSGTVAVAFAYRPRFDLVGAPAFNPDVQGVAIAVISHPSVPNVVTSPLVEAIDSTFAPHGTVGQYDGAAYAEAGFAYWPELLIGNISFVAGANVKSYKITYAYMDAQARLWRSRDSVAIQVSTNGVAPTINAPTLRVCGRAGVIIEIWRTQTGTSTFFQKAGVVANSLTADTVAFVDSVSDPTLAATGEVLYTEGGVRPNDTAPAATVAAIGLSRAYLRDEDDKQTIWPSMPFTLKGGLVFSEATAFDIRDAHGDVTAMAILGPDVVAIKSDAVYLVSGDGPDTLGRGGYNVQLLASDIGTNNPQSVVSSKDGVYFASTGKRAGIFMIDRGGTVQYIGGGVQRYVGETIVGAIVIPTWTQVRFYTSAQRVLVYDTVAQTWATFTTQGIPVSATTWNNVPTYADSQAKTWTEDTTGTNYTDNGLQYTMTVGTPWIAPAGRRGYFRTYRFSGLGERAGAHTLTVALYRDYDTSAAFKTATVTPGALWDWQFRYSAKMTALKVLLSETSSTAGSKMSTLELSYGARSAERPSAASKRAA